MSAETRLPVLLRTMRPRLSAEVFVFVALARGAAFPAGVSPVMTFREAEGMTLVVAADAAAEAGLEGTYRCRMITLEVRSALDAVGFLAAIAAALASRGISVNAASAFHHDHLFVAEAQAGLAMETLVSCADSVVGVTTGRAGAATEENDESA